jgi:molybdopterin converting factor small subunit
VKVLFYGRLAEMFGPALEVDAAPGCSVAELRELLLSNHPEAGPVLKSRRARGCVGDRLVRDDYVLSAADTLEFLPPVSGG